MKVIGNITEIELEKGDNCLLILKVPPRLYKEGLKGLVEAIGGIKRREAKALLLDKDIEVVVIKNINHITNAKVEMGGK